MITIGITVQRVVGGPRTYALELIYAILKNHPDISLRVFTDEKNLPLPKGFEQRCTCVYIPCWNKFFVVIWDNIFLALALKKHPVHILHHTKGVVPFFYKGLTVTNIHDAAPFIFPQSFSFFQKWYHQFTFKHAALHAEAIITVSYTSSADILKHIAVSPDILAVIYNGVTNTLTIETDSLKTSGVFHKYKLPKKYLLYMGTMQPRKNLIRLIHAYASLKQKHSFSHELVLAGRIGWQCKDLLSVIGTLNATTPVHCIGHVDESDKSSVYSLADAFISPSLYEGFGITVVEAMKCGVPVIASTAGSLPEVCADAAILVDPYDTEALSKAILSVLTSKDLRDSLIIKGKARAGEFLWEICADKTIDVYKKVLTHEKKN